MEFQSNELLSVLAYARQPSRDALHFNRALDFPPHRRGASSAFTTAAPLNAILHWNFIHHFSKKVRFFYSLLWFSSWKFKSQNIKRKKNLNFQIQYLLQLFLMQPTYCPSGRGKKTYTASEIVPTSSWVSETLSCKVSLNTLKRYVGTSYKTEERLQCVFYYTL